MSVSSSLFTSDCALDKLASGISTCIMSGDVSLVDGLLWGLMTILLGDVSSLIAVNGLLFGLTIMELGDVFSLTAVTGLLCDFTMARLDDVFNSTTVDGLLCGLMITGTGGD